MGDDHDDWIARAREVAGTLAADALDRDRANAEPAAEAKLLKSAGLPGLMVPERNGGAGQTWRTALAVVREIARADGSIAQLIGYHYVNSANLWLVGSEAIQERLGSYTLARSRPWVLGGHQAVTEEPYVLAQYGDHVARLAAVAALADKVARDLTAALAKGHALTWAERGELAVEVAKLKVVSTDTALEVTSKIFEVTGARSTDSRYGFDRFWRNVRTHTLHNPVAYRRREVGNHYLTGHAPEFTLYT